MSARRNPIRLGDHVRDRRGQTGYVVAIEGSHARIRWDYPYADMGARALSHLSHTGKPPLRRNAKPGYAHLEPPSRGYGARLPSEIRRASPKLGERVSLNVRDPRTGRAIAGVWQLARVGQGRAIVRNARGQFLNVPMESVRSVRNPWPVKLHSVVYLEKKPGDDREYPYEHEFEGTKPRLTRGLQIQRGGSRARVVKGWIHG